MRILRLVTVLLVLSCFAVSAEPMPEPMFTPLGPVWQPQPVSQPAPPPPQWAPANPPSTAPAPAPKQVNAVQEIISLINVERSRQGLSPLTQDRRLTAAAEGHSREMAQTENFSHTGARPGRARPADRVEAEGYNWASVSENIYMMQGMPESQLASTCVTAWMNSPGHRRNILDANVRNVGVAVVKNSRGKVYVTAVHGSSM